MFFLKVFSKLDIPRSNFFAVTESLKKRFISQDLSYFGYFLVFCHAYGNK